VDAGAGYTSYLWSTGDTTQTVTVDTASLGSGQQLLSVVVGNLSGCQGGDEIRINFINTSNYSLGADRQACADIPISLDAGAGFSSYIWSTGATTRTITLYAQDFPGGTGTISVNVATAQGCEATDSVEISFLPSPAVTITGNTVVCPNQSFTLSVATGFTGYFWSTGSGTNTESIDTSKTGYGPTDVIAIVTGANGCHGKDTVTVNFTRPVIAFAGADDHFCSLEDSYALLAATADQGTTYLWTSSGTGSFINAAQLNTSYEISSQDSTNGNVSLYLLASNACFSDNDTINIIIEDSAIVFAGSDSAICPGQNLLLTASGGAGNYSWTPSYGLSDTTIANPLANPATTTTYIVSMTSACGLATDDITVTIRQNPTANITGDTAKCAVDTITLNAGSVFASYYWSNGSHTADFIYYESVPGTYPIWVTVTDVFGCMDSDTAQIIVHPQPAIDLGADLTGCLNGSVLIDGGNGFESYLWTGGDTNQILMVDSTMQGAGIASYIVIVTDNYGCTNSDTIALTMFQNPVTNISGDTSFCINSSVILDAGAGFNSYSWNTGGTGRFLFVDSAIVGTGSTQISVIAYDANGCDATDQITMHVSGFPSGTAGNSGFFCASDTLLILNNAQVDVAESFFWTTTGSGVLDDSTAIHPSYGLTFQDSTGGIVDFILTIQTFCDILYDTITFNILHAAIADAGSDLEVCAGSSVIIQTTGPGTEFSWSPVTGLSDTLSASPTASPQITTIYTVTVSTACGTASDDVTVVVNELPTIFLGPDTLICANATIDLNAGPNFSTYNWSTGGSAQVEIIDSTGTGLGSTFVFVEVTDTNGCAGRDTIVITFDACAGINTSNIAEIALFPNPTSGSISLVSDINLAGGLFTVVNQDGKIVLQSYLGYSTTYKFDLSDLAPGTYLIRIEYEGKTQGRLLIRQ
ncbi:MAG: T9SS type A sorting domain-containing protein, partial [Bacteroidetes bacterium]|nr:T9SS type A sorting domain-containing protein [Bacteroidota bacterium]